MKFCKDCKHYDADYGLSCYRFQTLDPVRGPEPTYPPHERGTSGSCGPDALGFERRMALYERFGLWAGLLSRGE